MVGGEVCPRVRSLRRHVLKYVCEDRVDRATLLCQLTLGKVEGTIGRDNPFYVAVLIILSMLKKFQGDLEDAASHLRQALSIRQDILGSQHLAVVDLHNYLALCYIEMDNFDDAERHLQLGLEIKQFHFGENHADVARQLKNLALMYRHQHRYEKAAEHYDKAAKIYENRYGVKDPVTSRAANNSRLCSTKHKRWSIATYWTRFDQKASWNDVKKLNFIQNMANAEGNLTILIIKRSLIGLMFFFDEERRSAWICFWTT